MSFDLTVRQAPRMVEVEEVVVENPTVKTFYFKGRLDARPGQFIMLWLPGLNEKPFSLSFVGERTAVTVARVGPFTEQAFKIKAGDSFGVRGPYGTHYKPAGDNALVVCGGFGAASVAPLVEELREKSRRVYVIAGAKNSDGLFFIERFRAAGAQVCTTTDDGSSGIKCLATDNLPELHRMEKFDSVYSCGPEAMMKKVMDYALKEKIPCQLSLERYMKCGIGLCGACAMGEYRVCRDGPVFDAEKLSGTDFGLRSRDGSGIIKRI